MIITAIKKQERRDRYNVFVDGKFAAAFSANILATSGLAAGDTIKPGQLEQFVERDAYSKVLTKAYDYLSRRPHSTGELRTKLKRKEYEPALIDETLEHLTELGYLNDAEFARRWIDSRGSSRGPALLRQELRQKQLPGEVIDQALSDDRSQRDEVAEAEDLARRRLERLGNEPWESVYAKLSGYLSRRGYPYGTVRQVLATLKRERQTAASALG